ncbi:ABC transporter ATP-binding protein, partial [Candidatus Bathyarchaeota archaeon]
MRILEAKELSVETNGKLVVNKVSLHVNTGEIILLFGPNGSGKT